MTVDLGTRLVREELVSRADLERALAHSGRLGRPLASGLVDLGLLSEDGLVRFFRARLPFGEADRSALEVVAPEVAQQIPRAMAEEFGLLAIGRAGDTLSVAMVDPSNRHAIDEVGFFTGCTIVPLVARPSDLEWARDRLYPITTETAPLSVPLSAAELDDDAIVELVTRRDRTPQDAKTPRGANEGGVEITHVIALARPKVPTADDWVLPEPVRDTPVSAWESWDIPATADPTDAGADGPPTTQVRTITQAVPAGPNPAPPNLADPPAPTVTGVHEIAPARRSQPHGASPSTAAPALPPDADLSTLLGRLHRSSDRDEVIALAVAGAATVCRRSALFVVKKAVAQGWDARGEGVVSGAIRNVWIPVSSPSVLQRAAETLDAYVGPAEDTIANGILMAALGRRAERVGVWPVVVRERAIAILYADGFGPDAFGPIGELIHELAQAFERIILKEKSRR